PIGPIAGPAAICTPVLERLQAGAASLEQLSQLPVFVGQAGLLLQTLQLMMLADIVHPLNAQGAATDRAAQTLQHCLAQQGINLQLIAACGTAVRTVTAR
ncbi:MAG: hypothetical protein KBT18_08500, partial [Comamonas sp.]|nr:hypothetical protein [Candidatus Comamonas equi]